MTRRYPQIESPFLLDPGALPLRSSEIVDWGRVFDRPRPLRIEVGVGNSPFLIEVARIEPEFSYLGFEYCRRRALKFLKKVHAAELENIRVLQLHAADVMHRWIAEETVDHIFINFPDPWPKRKHARRRLVQRESMDLACRLLRPGGGISLRTDADRYARQMLEVLDGCGSLENLGGRGRLVEQSLYPFPTPYELKFRAEGRTIYYLEYRRRQGDGG
ncbi:MAG: tRNA (guanosine(46)-N7)-methyltransferase TrmB [Planctomycetes bacterium]|nr:tRNA (guanosine(46)-N7)-methyltransferase TrmB [Planctomycetota bacterium]